MEKSNMHLNWWLGFAILCRYLQISRLKHSILNFQTQPRFLSDQIEVLPVGKRLRFSHIIVTALRSFRENQQITSFLSLLSAWWGCVLLGATQPAWATSNFHVINSVRSEDQCSSDVISRSAVQLWIVINLNDGHISCTSHAWCVGWRLIGGLQPYRYTHPGMCKLRGRLKDCDMATETG